MIVLKLLFLKKDLSLDTYVNNLNGKHHVNIKDIKVSVEVIPRCRINQQVFGLNICQHHLTIKTIGFLVKFMNSSHP